MLHNQSASEDFEFSLLILFLKTSI